jgi:catechol-2,3-dioxygenase
VLIAGICELTLETRDMTAMERFYCGILGCEVLSRERDRLWLSCGERTRLGLWTPGEKEFGDEGGRHVHFAFAADPGCLDELAARMTEAGVEHRGPVQHEGGDRSVYVEDPMGNVVEVWDFFADREPDAPHVRELAP